MGVRLPLPLSPFEIVRLPFMPLLPFPFPFLLPSLRHTTLFIIILHVLLTGFIPVHAKTKISLLPPLLQCPFTLCHNGTCQKLTKGPSYPIRPTPNTKTCAAALNTTIKLRSSPQRGVSFDLFSDLLLSLFWWCLAYIWLIGARENDSEWNGYIISFCRFRFSIFDSSLYVAGLTEFLTCQWVNAAKKFNGASATVATFFFKFYLWHTSQREVTRPTKIAFFLRTFNSLLSLLFPMNLMNHDAQYSLHSRTATSHTLYSFTQFTTSFCVFPFGKRPIRSIYMADSDLLALVHPYCPRWVLAR